MKNFRNYEKCNDKISQLYKTNREYQTFDFVKRMIEKYCTDFTIPLTIEDIMSRLDEFIDLSDPDLSLPNSIHAIQTAEKIRKDNCPDWMILVGLIHDFGKVLSLKGCPIDGTDLTTQWALVGDTFITGHEIPLSIIFPNFNISNNDIKNKYQKHCGLENTLVSFGHDEYLYHVLKNHKNCKLPMEAYYMIRYHSLYVWHKENEYQDLENEQDVLMKPWVQRFNKYDLYSKSNDDKISFLNVKHFYLSIAKKYGLDGIIYW